MAEVETLRSIYDHWGTRVSILKMLLRDNSLSQDDMAERLHYYHPQSLTPHLDVLEDKHWIKHKESKYFKYRVYWLSNPRRVSQLLRILNEQEAEGDGLNATY